MSQGWGAALQATSDRLRSHDLPQVGLLVLAVLVVALGIAWPGRPEVPNEAWYALAQTRSVVLALFALGYGMQLPLEGPSRALGTVVGVQIIALSTLPLDLVAHVGSSPATPAWWAWAMTPASVAGYLACGAALGWTARRLRLSAIAPLLAPAVVVGAVALDVRLGVTLLNPLTAALHVTTPFLAAHAVAATIGIAAAWVARRRGWRGP